MKKKGHNNRLIVMLVFRLGKLLLPTYFCLMANWWLRSHTSPIANRYHYKRRHRMKIKLTIIFLTLIQLSSYSQDTFTSRKGSKFFPGHHDVVITVNNKNVRYELFNHWYCTSLTSPASARGTEKYIFAMPCNEPTLNFFSRPY